MTEEWISTLVAWVPFLLLLLVGLYFSRNAGMRSRGPSGATLIELYEQQVAETRRLNATLERVAIALEKRVEKS